MNKDAVELPCGRTCQSACEIRKKMVKLEGTLEFPSSDSTTQFVDKFLESYGRFYAENKSPSPNIALPALFDLIVSADYAKRMVADGGWTYCSGETVNEGSELYFPYLKTCPRCSAKTGARPSIKANKPGSDTIGEVSGNATVLILSRILKVTRPNAVILRSSDRQGDIDFVVYDPQKGEEKVILGEIKSSPLAVYPLGIKLDKKLTEVRDGNSVPKANHSPATTRIDKEEMFLYVPHADLKIGLGRHTGGDWPFPALTKFVAVSGNVGVLLSAWQELYDVYSSSWRNAGHGENRRWLICGCGGGVDDSKNAPGIDRTDDIKKGTYQVLKYGAYYKEKCAKRVMAAVLVSNFFPVHTFERYLSEMHDILWTKEKYSVQLKEQVPLEDVRAFRGDSVFNLYDGIVCLTGSIFQEQKLKSLFGLEDFEKGFLS